MLKKLALLDTANGSALKVIIVMRHIFHLARGKDCKLLKILRWKRKAPRALYSHRTTKGSVLQGSATWAHREHHENDQRKLKLY